MRHWQTHGYLSSVPRSSLWGQPACEAQCEIGDTEQLHNRCCLTKVSLPPMFCQPGSNQRARKSRRRPYYRDCNNGPSIFQDCPPGYADLVGWLYVLV
jgi:hypothetical protein